jgi:hypothetical protein
MSGLWDVEVQAHLAELSGAVDVAQEAGHAEA